MLSWVCASVCLSVCVCLFVCLYLCLSVFLSVCECINLNNLPCFIMIFCSQTSTLMVCMYFVCLGGEGEGGAEV